MYIHVYTPQNQRTSHLTTYWLSIPLMQDDRTALAVAIEKGHTEVINILQSVSPKPEVKVRKNKQKLAPYIVFSYIWHNGLTIWELFVVSHSRDMQHSLSLLSQYAMFQYN